MDTTSPLLIEDELIEFCSLTAKNRVAKGIIFLLRRFVSLDPFAFNMVKEIEPIVLLTGQNRCQELLYLWVQHSYGKREGLEIDCFLELQFALYPAQIGYL